MAAIAALGILAAAIWQAATVPAPPMGQHQPVAKVSRAAPDRESPPANVPAVIPSEITTKTVVADSTTLPRGPGGKVESATIKAAPVASRPGTDDAVPRATDKSVRDASPDSSIPENDTRDAPEAIPDGDVPAPAKDAAITEQSEKRTPHEPIAIDADAEYDHAAAEDFACPVPWLRDSKMTERVKYLTALQNILKGGWEEKPSALETARGHFKTAKRLCADDPRLGYSFGLVLWKHGLHSEARKEWEAATRTGSKPFLPALSVLAWASLLDHEEPGGFAAIDRLAEAATQPPGEYPTSAQRLHAVLFLGRAVGFLKGPGRSPELIDRVLQTEQKLRAGLPDELSKTFEHGQVQAAKHFEQFQRRVERPEAEVVAELQREKQRLAEELSSLRKDVKQLDERRRVIPREAKVQLDALARESADLEQKIDESAMTLQQGHALANELSLPQRIFAGYRTYKEEVLVKGNDKQGKEKDRYETVTRQEPVYRNETPQEVDVRLKKRGEVLAKVNGIAQEIRQSKDRYREIPPERNELMKAFRQEKLEQARSATAARRKIAELVALERDLGKDFASPEELEKRMRSLAPYVPWTPETDREGLAASYRQSTSQPKSPQSPLKKKTGSGSKP